MPPTVWVLKASTSIFTTSLSSSTQAQLTLALVQLPWDVIYTTNYDNLVEQAAQLPSIVPAGRIVPVFSAKEEVSQFGESDVPYYKLHGSIEAANTDEGRLILTREDYRYYELNRKPLFTRLKRELLRRTFVFIGYSLCRMTTFALYSTIAVML